MRIRMRCSIRLKEQGHVEEGTELDVPDAVGWLLVGEGRAYRLGERAPIIDHRDPPIMSRDPRPKAKR